MRGTLNNFWHIYANASLRAHSLGENAWWALKLMSVICYLEQTKQSTREKYGIQSLNKSSDQLRQWKGLLIKPHRIRQRQTTKQKKPNARTPYPPKTKGRPKAPCDDFTNLSIWKQERVEQQSIIDNKRYDRDLNGLVGFCEKPRGARRGEG